MRATPLLALAVAAGLEASGWASGEVAHAVAGGGEEERQEHCLSQAYPQTRADFPALLNCLGLVQEAVEVGVQAGVHAKGFLEGWKGRRLRLVDLWSSQDDGSGSRFFYVDIANVHGAEIRRQHRVRCEARLADALASGRAELVHMDSTVAATTVADGELDFVYLDARHDFAGVVADITAWWPKVKTGGIFAGHDYVDGEFPEGDFFWKSALREVIPGLDAHAKVTHETNLYPSFFVVKTSALGSFEPQAVATEVLSRRLYAERSAYFALWRERAASGHGAAFRDGPGGFLASCRGACGGACAERVSAFTPTRTAGSTLRPFVCTEQPAAAAEPAAAGAATGRGVAAGGAEATAPDTCGAEMLVNVDEYRSICVERCNVTCQQRDDLFSTFGDEILAA